MASRPSLKAFLSLAEVRAHDAEPQPLAVGAPSRPDPPLSAIPPPPRRPAPAADNGTVFIRVTSESLAAVRALAEAEGVTVQDLGVYALNLALVQYGRPPVVRGKSRAG